MDLWERENILDSAGRPGSSPVAASSPLIPIASPPTAAPEFAVAKEDVVDEVAREVLGEAPAAPSRPAGVIVPEAAVPAEPKSAESYWPGDMLFRDGNGRAGRPGKSSLSSRPSWCSQSVSLGERISQAGCRGVTCTA